MKLLVALSCILLAAGSVDAQTIRGTVVEQDSRAALPGAFVVLHDSAGKRHSATLSDSAGRFYLRAPHVGIFSISTELIGHETTRNRVVADANGRAITVVLPVAAVKLEALNVSSERRCTGRPERMHETARVWDEVRKALTVASWTEKENRTHFEVRNFERFLDPRTSMLLRENLTTSTRTGRPYAAVSADSLAQFGFVRSFGDGTVFYFGPDADVLLSDAFLDTHCFWLRRGQRATAGLIGLAFEPVPNRQMRDITGTLWVDARTSELKFIEYRFTRLSSDQDVPGVGGRTDFRRMANGAWIVDRWFIRMPGGAITARGFMVNALVESGGEIISARVDGASDDALRKTAISGSVYDSVGNKPLANAVVYLSGTAHRATTDSAGHFTINDVTKGHYVVAFWHSAFDSLPALPDPKAVAAVGQTPVYVRLAIPPSAELLARACSTYTTGGVLTGYARTGDGSPLPGEAVVATYTADGRVGVRRGETDPSGRFVLCALPLNTKLSLKAGAGKAVSVRVGATRFVRKDINTSGGTAQDD